MSVIGKVRISRPNKRSKIPFMSDCSTSANFGEVQPTFCRELAKDVSIKLKNTSLVRLASMPLPTFARMDFRQYHAFVPMSTLYEPFGSLLSAQHYTTESGLSYIPGQMPRINLRQVWAMLILRYSFVYICRKNDILHPFDDIIDVQGALPNILENGVYFGNSVIPAQYVDERLNGLYTFGTFKDNSAASPNGTGGIVAGNSILGTQVQFDNPVPSVFTWYTLNLGQDEDTQAYPTGVNALSADLTCSCGDYVLCFKFMPFLKHLRKIVVGLGYQFNPFDWNLYDNPYKLFAYYKTWFEFFRPSRELTWVDTKCYKLLKKLQNPEFSADCPFFNIENPLQHSYSWLQDFYEFILDLMNDTFYYLPSDYFTMATLQTQQGNSDMDSTVQTVLGKLNSDPNITTVSQSSDTGEVTVEDYPNSPLLQKMALKLLAFTNKNTVIGRGIREYLLAHYGISDDSAIDSTGVYRVGVSNLSIKIRDVLSTAENEQGYLGEYGGYGIGMSESESFDYHASEFGYFLTLSVVIPRSGYYQGTMRENYHASRFDFYLPEFDALGYQILERRELMDSFSSYSAGYSTPRDNWNPSVNYQGSKGYGFVPRYSEYKVGRNIVNGDLSIPGMPSMRPYFFDRRFPENGVVGRDSNTILSQPDFIPSVVFDDMRKVDPTDKLGQYNRIFNVNSNWFDHFIIHIEQDISLIAPYKPIADSFDTFQEGEDVVEVTHS